MLAYNNGQINNAQVLDELIKMAQESEAVLGNLIEDTVEISQEAMQKFMAERSA